MMKVFGESEETAKVDNKRMKTAYNFIGASVIQWHICV
jgi:hypothetical protein